MRLGAELDENYIRPLDRTNTRGIDRTGGTMLHTSRTNPQKIKAANLPAHLSERERKTYDRGDGTFDLTPVVHRNVEALGLDHLIVIGGDDTLSFAHALDNAAAVPLMGIPKTMDNDVQGTEYCIGVFYGDYSRERINHSAAERLLARTSASEYLPHFRSRCRLPPRFTRRG